MDNPALIRQGHVLNGNIIGAIAKPNDELPLWLISFTLEVDTPDATAKVIIYLIKGDEAQTPNSKKMEQQVRKGWKGILKLFLRTLDHPRAPINILLYVI
jgi:hypothetical protein